MSTAFDVTKFWESHRCDLKSIFSLSFSACESLPSSTVRGAIQIRAGLVVVIVIAIVIICNNSCSGGCYFSVIVGRYLRCAPFDELKVWKRQVDNRTGELRYSSSTIASL